MARFARSQYVVDKSNTNYINAIVNYNRNVCIEKINYKDVSASRFFGEDLLTKVIPTIPGDSFGMEVFSRNAASTMGALPAIDAPRLLSAMPTPLNAEAINTAGQVYEQMSQHIQSLTRRGGFDVYIGPLDSLPALTESQAIWLLNKLQNNYNVVGAMMFAAEKAIVLQHNGENYILRYGSEKSFFGEMQTMSLDIDDGFSMPTDLGAEDIAIAEALQVYFQDWKNNNYAGPLIRPEQSGFRYGQTNVMANVATLAMSGLGLHKPAAASMPMDVSPSAANGPRP